MPIIRKFAIQGHAVPNGMTRPLGPFPPELFQNAPVVYDTEELGDSLHEALDDVRYFRCKECNETLAEYELTAHKCEETT
jgi:hypothetical protein